MPKIRLFRVSVVLGQLNLIKSITRFLQGFVIKNTTTRIPYKKRNYKDSL